MVVLFEASLQPHECLVWVVRSNHDCLWQLVWLRVLRELDKVAAVGLRQVLLHHAYSLQEDVWILTADHDLHDYLRQVSTLTRIHVTRR